jgi:hypothetical protein
MGIQAAPAVQAMPEEPEERLMNNFSVCGLAQF